MPNEMPSRPGFRTPSEITAYFYRKQLLSTFSWLDLTSQEHANFYTVPKVFDITVLGIFQQSIGIALERGLSFETWRRPFMTLLAEVGWAEPRIVRDPLGLEPPEAVDFTEPDRLRPIFWEGMSTACSAGQWIRALRTRAALPYLLYVTGPPCPLPHHSTWDGVILRIDDPLWHTHWPPNGLRCLCSVRCVTDWERTKLLSCGSDGRRPYSSTPPDDGPAQAVFNKRTGAWMSVPFGVEPGWDGNSGRDQIGQCVG